MKRMVFAVLVVGAVVALTHAAQAAKPTTPFTPDADTLLLLHFDGDLVDSSANAYTGEFSSIPTYTTPSYVAGQSGFGQAISGGPFGTNMNGVTIAQTALSTIASTPLTVEAWFNVPAGNEDNELTNSVIDLAGGKFRFDVRFAGAGDPNLYPIVFVYNGTAFEYTYARVTPADGWTYGDWHHFAMTYQVGRTPAVEFFFDGMIMPTFNGGTPVVSEWVREAQKPLTAGRAWPPSAPTENTNSLVGSIDEVRVSKSIRYGSTGSDPTLLYLKFDGNLTDSGPIGWPVAMSAISGRTDPVYTAAPSPYGQALTADGGSINGVYVSNGQLSLTASPLTLETRFFIPTSRSGQEFSNCLFDLAAGRLLVMLRHAGSPDVNGYIEVNIYNPSVLPETNYFVITPAHGWQDGTWHHYAVTFDPTRLGGVVEVFFDGKKLTKYNNGVYPPITSDFQRSADYPLFAGRVWPPAAPVNNLMPLIGSVDELKISKGVLYPPAGSDQAIRVRASEGPVTVDGDPSEWGSLLFGQHIALDTGGRGTLQCNVQVAWDTTYLYFLAQETAADATQKEAPSAIEYGTNATGMGPWNFDGVSLYIDLNNSNDAEAIQDFNPWFGFSSTGRTDLFTARINNQPALTTAPFLGATVATGGTFAGGNRVIEARIRWSDLAAVVDPVRQPSGNLQGAIAPLYIFGCEPLLIDDDYNKQSFIGGSQYTVPNGSDLNSRDIILVSSELSVPSSIWPLYE